MIDLYGMAGPNVLKIAIMLEEMELLARHGFSSLEHPHLVSWRDKLDERPAVKRAVATITAGAEKATEALKAAGTEDYDRFFNRSAAGGPVGRHGQLSRAWSFHLREARLVTVMAFDF
jgi:hypothetical protein